MATIKELLDKGVRKMRRKGSDIYLDITASRAIWRVKDGTPLLDMAQNFSFAELSSDLWEPYPTPVEKCPACKEAEGFFQDNWIAKHLRNYHCTCKEKP